MKRSAHPLPSGSRIKGLDTEVVQFLLKIIGHLGGSVVMSHRQSVGDLFGVVTEVGTHPLADRL